MASSMAIRSAQGSRCSLTTRSVLSSRPNSGTECCTLASALRQNGLKPSKIIHSTRRSIATRSVAVEQPDAAKAESVSSDEAEATDTNDNPDPRFDVASNCVTPVFRSAPWQGSSDERETDEDKANILFLSEGNVCRSVYAEAIFNGMLAERGLDKVVACASKASRDYNQGEPPDPRAVQVAEELGIRIPEGATARLIDHAKDIVQFDLVLCFDKFNAADVLKEVSVYDTIDSKGRYSARVRRLGEFANTRQIEELDDPLYGNMGGPDEFENLRQSARDIWDCCDGLINKLEAMHRDLPEGETLAGAVAQSLAGMEALDWLVPPMLQKR